MSRNAKSDYAHDFKDILKCLNRNACRYLVVGAHAMAAWGYVRATGDLDIFIEPNKTNAKKIWNALKSFGAPLSGIKMDDFVVLGTIYQVGVAPIRVDFLNRLEGVSFGEAYRSSRKISFMGEPCRVLSLRHLIRNKTSVGRPQDKIDVKRLKALSHSSKGASHE